MLQTQALLADQPVQITDWRLFSAFSALQRAWSGSFLPWWSPCFGYWTVFILCKPRKSRRTNWAKNSSEGESFCPVSLSLPSVLQPGWWSLSLCSRRRIYRVLWLREITMKQNNSSAFLHLHALWILIVLYVFRWASHREHVLLSSCPQRLWAAHVPQREDVYHTAFTSRRVLSLCVWRTTLH